MYVWYSDVYGYMYTFEDLNSTFTSDRVYRTSNVETLQENVSANLHFAPVLDVRKTGGWYYITVSVIDINNGTMIKTGTFEYQEGVTTTLYPYKTKEINSNPVMLQYMTWSGSKAIGKTSGAAVATIQFPDSVNTVHSLLLQNQDTGIYLYPYSLTSVNFIVYGRNFFTGTTATCSNLHILAFTS